MIPRFEPDFAGPDPDPGCSCSPPNFVDPYGEMCSRCEDLSAEAEWARERDEADDAAMEALIERLDRLQDFDRRYGFTNAAYEMGFG